MTAGLPCNQPWYATIWLPTALRCQHSLLHMHKQKIVVHLIVCVQDPVCTPEGFLFSKEAIIENLIQQKKAIKRKHAAWEAQQSDDQQKAGCMLPLLAAQHMLILMLRGMLVVDYVLQGMCCF